jgi:hypothetical protein
MQKIIAFAAVASAFAFAATRSHVHAHTGHTVKGSALVTVAPDARPVGVNPPVDSTIYVGEITVYGTARKGPKASSVRETDMQHAARLMAAPVEMVDCAGCTPRGRWETYTGKVSRLSPEAY